jgi:hypothetical protein
MVPPGVSLVPEALEEAAPDDNRVRLARAPEHEGWGAAELPRARRGFAWIPAALGFVRFFNVARRGLNVIHTRVGAARKR